MLLNTIVVRLVFPTAAVGLLGFAAEQEMGLLAVYPLPPLLALVLAVVALDFVIRFQHAPVDAVPALGRLHRVHHADPDYDLTTGRRPAPGWHFRGFSLPKSQRH